MRDRRIHFAWNDGTRTAAMALVSSSFNLAVLFGLDISPIQMAGIDLVVGNAVILAAFAFPKGQGKNILTGEQTRE